MTGVAVGAGEASKGMATRVESKGGTDGGGHRLGTNLNCEGKRNYWRLFGNLGFNRNSTS